MQTSFYYTGSELAIAGVNATVDLMAVRTYEDALAEASIALLLAALDAGAASFFPREPPRLASLVPKAAVFHVVAFRGDVVAHSGWGLNSGDSTALCEEARSDLWSFSSSLHVFACPLGSWPVRWLSAIVDVALA